MSSINREQIRYGSTVAGGFILDFIAALVLVELVGLPLQAATVLGFVSAFLVNYILFEMWVFQARHVHRLSLRRLLRTAIAAGLALGVRTSVVHLLGSGLGASLIENAATILIASVASLIVNYLFLRKVFSRT